VSLLVIETSTSNYEVGVVTGASCVISTGNRFQPDYDGIAGLVERCLAEAGTDVSALDAIAVDRGPGNLISVRAGLAYANALAYAAGLPLYTANSLEIMARAAIEEAGDEHEDEDEDEDEDDNNGDRRAPVFVARAARNNVSGLFFAAVYEGGAATFMKVDYLTKICDPLVGRYHELVLAGTHIEAQADFLEQIPTIHSGVTRPGAGPLSALLRKGMLPATQQAFPLTEESEEFRV
jgi:tRNA threonylcarbamoyladenosine biosynthesis protein TsaB